jgi:hypothetical protein
VDFTQILPTELIEEILKYVPASKHLFLINKRINGIIGNSEQLMKKFELSWSDLEFKNDIDILLETKRKYSVIRISETAMKNLIPLLERLPIKKLYISFCSLKSLEIHRILTAVAEKVESIRIICVSVPDIDQIKTLKLLEFKKLTKLKMMHNNETEAAAVLPFRSAENLKLKPIRKECALSYKYGNPFEFF